VLARTLSPPEPAAAKPAALTWRPIWTLRLLPIALCLHCLGRELQLGQVDIFLLALLAVMTACAAEGRSGQAGLWHAVAICLKVMPVILLVYPLWRRDWRWLLTCAGGMVIGLVLIPMLIVGPHKALKYTLAYNHKLVLPAITGNVTDHARDGEWFYQNAVHNYSIMGVLHNLENITLARDDRPLTVSVQDRNVAAFLGVLLLVVTLLASGFRRQVSRPTTILSLSMLTAVMLITSPVCQSYYFVLLIPLFMAVIAADLRQSGARFPRRSTLAVCVAYPAAQAISSFSPFLRDSGIVLAAVLALWLLALKTLNECRRESQSSD
ncbi:MAG TPA: glycosyltransferase family 87 protein, partial [Verrucomicrobiae bacterium]|nr:glycosyltransferase family 87 protein [Verrucomicrobiae bacterium]